MTPTLGKSVIQIAITAVVSLTSSGAFAAVALTNPSDPVGNPAFGATVQTFINLGITPGDGTGGTTYIENGLWTNPANFTLGTYVKGAEGWGFGYDPTTLGAYNGAGSAAANANALDYYWVQDTSPNVAPGGASGSGPSNGIIWDLGGQSNQLAVFVFVDHGPVPEEVLENTAWLSNDPNAADGGWTQASLVHVYGAGWAADPDIADGFVAVYQLPGGGTFQYASVTWGGPGAVQRDGDNEIDAVGGLTFEGGGVGGVPEPASLIVWGVLLLLGSGIHFVRRQTA